MKDDAAVGYRVRAKDREDIVIVSDGKYRKFTHGIEGDFTYARISSTAGGVDYAGFSGVSKFKIDGVTMVRLQPEEITNTRNSLLTCHSDPMRWALECCWCSVKFLQ